MNYINTNQDTTSLNLTTTNATGSNLVATSILNASGNVNVTTATISNLALTAGHTISNMVANSCTFPTNTTHTNKTTGTLYIPNYNIVYLKSTRGFKTLLKKVTGVANGVTTSLATVTVTQNAGNNAGAFAIKIKGSVGHGGGAEYATKNFEADFSKSSTATGAGDLSTIDNVTTFSSSATNSGVKNIGTITISVVLTSNSVTTISINVSLSGSSITSADIITRIECLYGVLTNDPVLS